MTIIDFEDVRQRCCDRCGAYAANRTTHAAWHEQHDQIVISIADALTALQEADDLLLEGGQTLGETVDRLIALIVGPDPGRNGHHTSGRTL